VVFNKDVKKKGYFGQNGIRKRERRIKKGE